MSPSYAARRSPRQPETIWTLEKAHIVERRAGRERRFPLADLRGVGRRDSEAVLKFRRRQLTIPATGQAAGPHDFEAFLAALDAAAPRRPLHLASPRAEAVLWIMGLMGVGAVALLLASGLAGAWLLGLALAARLVFVLILGAAVLPWLGSPRKPRRKSALQDEHDLS
jgi:hypothetical protein